MLIVDHLIHLITSKKLKTIDQSIQTLMSILNLNLSLNPNHFVAAYYRYFKYLEEKDISFAEGEFKK